MSRGKGRGTRGRPRGSRSRTLERISAIKKRRAAETDEERQFRLERWRQVREKRRLLAHQREVKKRKPNPRKCEQKKSNHASESEGESVMSCNPPGFLMYGNSCGETITSDITNQYEEHTKTFVGCIQTSGILRNYLEKRTPLQGYPGVTTTTIERDDLVFDPKLMVLKSNVVPEIHIDDELIVDDEPMVSEDENVVSTILQNLNGALRSNIDNGLIAGTKESESFQCKKEPSSENNSNDASELNGLIINSEESEVLQCKKEPCVENELGARSSVVENPCNPVIVVKREISESEFNSESQLCCNPEPQHCPDPELQHCPDPELPHCSNPKCLESISQLKTKVAGLKFQLQESLRMSGAMSLKVQNVLEDKQELEDKLQRAEKEILYFKQKYSVPR